MEEKWPVTVINIHAVIGGILGAISMFLPWVVRNGSQEYSLVDFLTESVEIGFSLELVLPLCAALFLLGTVTVFISPYGATAQLAGVSMAFFTINIAAMANSGDETLAVGLGFYVGILSIVVAFLSIIFPFGLGYGHWKPLGNRGRNYTVSYYRYLDDSDGMPYWWWIWGPGWFWYWWFEMRMGWAFRDAWAQHQKRVAERIVRDSDTEDGIDGSR